MARSEFDRFAHNYKKLHKQNVHFLGDKLDYFAEYKIRDIRKALLAKKYIADSNIRILDFGCGTGSSIVYFRQYFKNASLICIDVSLKSIRIAKSENGNLAEFLMFDGKTIPLHDGSIDVAFAACVFHHIDPIKRQNTLSELYRVLKDSGRLFIYEHNPFNPLTQFAVNTCPMDENARLISGKEFKTIMMYAGFIGLDLRYRLFFPPQLSIFLKIEMMFSRIPFGAQYYVEGIKSESKLTL